MCCFTIWWNVTFCRRLWDLGFQIIRQSHSTLFDIRGTFPYFYLYVLVNSGIAAALSFFVNKSAFLLLILIFVTTIPNRQFLMPAINNAADSGNKKTWGMLHGLSVIITLTHIALSGAALKYLL